MKLLLSFSTRIGTFHIGESSDGYFCSLLNGECLGRHRYIWQATEDLANGVMLSVPHPDSGKPINTSLLGIPRHPGQWDSVAAG